MADEIIIDPLSGRVFIDPDTQKVLKFGSDPACCCSPTVCFSLPCLTVTVSAITGCPIACLDVPDFPGGTFKVPLFASSADSCQWYACFPGLGDEVCDRGPMCDGEPPLTCGCPQFFISVGWSRGVSPGFGITIATRIGLTYYAWFFEAFDGPISDGLVVPGTRGAPCPDAGGSVTFHLPDGDGACTGTVGDPCVGSDCAPLTPCADCAASELESSCGSLPESVTFSSLTMCNRTPSGSCGETAACVPATITLTKVDNGGTCGTAPGIPVIYTGTVLDGDGHTCIAGTLTWNGISWYVEFIDACQHSIMWGGYLNAGLTGPDGTYSISCSFSACTPENSAVCTISTGDVCTESDCSCCPDTYTGVVSGATGGEGTADFAYVLTQALDGLGNPTCVWAGDNFSDPDPHTDCILTITRQVDNSWIAVLNGPDGDWNWTHAANGDGSFCPPTGSWTFDHADGYSGTPTLSIS